MNFIIVNMLLAFMSFLYIRVWRCREITPSHCFNIGKFPLIVVSSAAVTLCSKGVFDIEHISPQYWEKCIGLIKSYAAWFARHEVVVTAITVWQYNRKHSIRMTCIVFASCLS